MLFGHCQLESEPLAKAIVTHRVPHTAGHIFAAGHDCAASRGGAHVCTTARQVQAMLRNLAW
eukprot:9124500-Alexandrium_andersonii.AAC.1